MVEAVRRENLSQRAPTINRNYTDTYKVSGMFSDNSMSAALIRLEQLKQAKQRA